MLFLNVLLVALVVGLSIHVFRLRRQRSRLFTDIGERVQSQEWLAAGWEQTEDRAGRMELERNLAIERIDHLEGELTAAYQSIRGLQEGLDQAESKLLAQTRASMDANGLFVFEQPKQYIQ